MLPSLLTKLATCVDPFAYALNQPKIRKELLNRLHRLSTAVLHSSGPVFNDPDRASPYFHQRDQISPSALLDCSSRQHLTVWERSDARTDYNIRGILRYQYSYNSSRPADKSNVNLEDDGAVNRPEPNHSFIIPHITFSELQNTYSDDGNQSEFHTMSYSKQTASQAEERMNVDAEVIHVIDNYNNENSNRNAPNIFSVISSAALMRPNIGDNNDPIINRRVPETLI